MLLSLTIVLASLLGGAAPGVEGHLTHPLAVHLGESLEVAAWIRNPGTKPVTLSGRVADDEKNLVLSGDFGLTLVRLSPDGVASSRDLRPADAGEGEPLVLPDGPEGHTDFHFTLDLGKLVTEEGSYRLDLRIGEKVFPGRPFRVAKTRDPPDWIHMTAVAEPAEARLGQPVTVRFRMENAGELPFSYDEGGDYRGANRHLRFAMTAKREDGLAAVDPFPGQMCMGGLGAYDPVLGPGESYETELPLLAYLRFPAPGVYSVRVYHDLGFGEPIEEPGNPMWGDYAVGADFTVTILPAAPEDRRKIIEEMLRERDDWERKALFTRLYDVAYLPDLIALLSKEKDEERASALAVGVGSIPDLAATKALVALASDPRAAVRTVALRGVLPRLPGEPKFTNQAEGEYDDKLTPSVLAALRGNLLSSDFDELSAAAAAVERVGTADFAELLAAAAERIAPGPGTRGDAAWTADRLGYAAAKLAERGAPIVAVADDSGEGRLGAWAHMARVLADSHGPEWEKRILRMLRTDSAVTRRAAIVWLPEDFRRRDEIPWKELFVDPDLGVWWQALQVARAKPPAGIADAVRAALSETDDYGRNRDLEDFLKELGDR